MAVEVCCVAVFTDEEVTGACITEDVCCVAVLTDEAVTGACMAEDIVDVLFCSEFLSLK